MTNSKNIIFFVDLKIWCSVITGGGDGVINILDSGNYATIVKLTLDNIIKNSFSTKVRAATFASDNKTLLIGTYGSEIYEISTK